MTLLWTPWHPSPPKHVACYGPRVLVLNPNRLCLAGSASEPTSTMVVKPTCVGPAVIFHVCFGHWFLILPLERKWQGHFSCAFCLVNVHPGPTFSTKVVVPD